jgi:zona occludens toxin
MAIILITGLPGHGKTLYTLSRFRKIHEPPPVGEARPVFHASGKVKKDKGEGVHGIPGLKLPWEAFDPLQWAQLPAGSVGIVDEAQFVFPVRQGRGEPPTFVAELATHRHLGVDLVLVTQHPGLLDPFVRKLVDQHFHVKRKFGTNFATVLEFPNGVRENVDKSTKGAILHEWRYPKDVFDLYTSAELHTVKRRLPMRLVMFAMVPVFLIFAGIAYKRLTPDNQRLRAEEAAGVKHDGKDKPGQPASQVAPAKPVPNARAGAQWVSNFAPRVAGLPHTAPAYDELTRPQEAPYPAYCVSMGAAYACKCFTQRGTGLDVPRATCDSIAKGGFFAYWTGDRRQVLEASRGTGAEAPVSRAAVQTDQAPQGPYVPPGGPNGG